MSRVATTLQSHRFLSYLQNMRSIFSNIHIYDYRNYVIVFICFLKKKHFAVENKYMPTYLLFMINYYFKNFQKTNTNQYTKTGYQYTNYYYKYSIVYNTYISFGTILFHLKCRLHNIYSLSLCMLVYVFLLKTSYTNIHTTLC